MRLPWSYAYLPCIKTPKLFLNSSKGLEHISIKWGYKSEADGGKQG